MSWSVLLQSVSKFAQLNISWKHTLNARQRFSLACILFCSFCVFFLSWLLLLMLLLMKVVYLIMKQCHCWEITFYPQYHDHQLLSVSCSSFLLLNIIHDTHSSKLLELTCWDTSLHSDKYANKNVILILTTLSKYTTNHNLSFIHVYIWNIFFTETIVHSTNNKS